MDQISGGGDINALIDGSIAEVTSNVESIRGYAFSRCESLITASFTQASTIADYSFGYCGKLREAVLPNAITVGEGAFRQCVELVTIDLSSATDIGLSAFESCRALGFAEFRNAKTIRTYAFQGCSTLKSFVLSNQNEVCALSSYTAFSSTPIASGSGYIYVPRALMDEYKSADRWSTYADQFRAIEDYLEVMKARHG